MGDSTENHEEQANSVPSGLGPEPPAELRAVAAALGAISAGPAPTRQALEEVLPKPDMTIKPIDAGSPKAETMPRGYADELTVESIDAGPAPTRNS